MSEADFHYFLDKLKVYLSSHSPYFDSLQLGAVVDHFFEENADQLDTEQELEEMKTMMVELIAFIQQRPPEYHKADFLSNIVNTQGELPVLVTIDSNRPFIVESIQMQFERMGITPVHRYTTLILVKRDAQGILQHIEPYVSQDITPQSSVESLLTFHLPTTLDQAQQDALIQRLSETLNDLRLLSNEWSMMTQQAKICAERLTKHAPDSVVSAPQVAQFIHSLIKDKFTFMATAEYACPTHVDSELWRRPTNQAGLLRDSRHQFFSTDTGSHYDQALQEFYAQDEICCKIVKSQFPSPLRRDVHLDVLFIKRYNTQGECTGTTMLAGLFAWSVFAEPLKNVPMLAERVNMILAQFGTKEKSYAGRQLIHLCENYPREQIFHISFEDFYQHIQRMRRIYRRQEFGVLTFYEQLNHCITFTVHFLRANYSSSLRKEMIDYFRSTLEVDKLEYTVHLPNDSIWRVHFTLFLSPAQAVPQAALLKDIKQTLQKMSLGAFERLRIELSKQNDSRYVALMCQRYAKAFSTQYWRQNSMATVTNDIAEFESMVGENILVRAKLWCEAGQWQVRLYNRTQDRIFLSDIMPMLERMGLHVLQQVPYNIKLGVPQDNIVSYSLLVFEVAHARLSDDAITEIQEHFSDCMQALFNQKTEIDNFLALVINACLPWRDINLLRAYSKYIRQINAPYSLRFLGDTLNLFPDIARILVALFYARFDPDNSSKKLEEQYIKEIEALLGNVSVLDQDGALSLFKNLILATLRSNYFQTDSYGQPKSTISLKLSPRGIDIIPDPVPLREIFVYSTDFEAVHLRFGMVSRGGLRWSDRTEDFRTEVLGLVKAQQVKNAVIVPMGSKGGFVLKNPPAERKSLTQEGIRCYRLFISSMLDITDSYTQDQDIRKPAQVVCHDEDDPYLVVAADKGTAAFSDFANEVSASHDFWLGDAFASGGSVGYDHKKMGITARGAWESVKRHFREMGHNTQTTPFDVVGVGDMSGDVFGNGMLLSEHIRLIGAFNHLHIFVDPDPDPATSYAERQRLFALSHSNWADYDQSVLSKGGAIFDRQAKELDLTPEIQQRLGLEQEKITPNNLIRALMMMPSDLLWFGGIGTYVKASHENNLEVGDKANDLIRINGNQVGAKVIGEGANLGVTQLARIEFSRHGGRCNTDAIDNSAGVNCSDAEVNIKILLTEAMNRGTLARDERDKLLESMTEEVGKLVLVNNYQQTLSLSVTEDYAPRLLSMHRQVMQHFERLGELDRALEELPSDDDLEDLRNQSKGLTRPEIAVLLAYGKNITYQTLLDSPFLDYPILEPYLLHYFPTTLRERFEQEILSHQLRRQIIATVVTNTVLNRSGVGFIVEMTNLTGRSIDEICAAYMIVVEIFGLNAIWKQVEGLDNKLPTALQHKMMAETATTIRRMTEWLLMHTDGTLSMQEKITMYSEGLAELARNLSDVLSPATAIDVEERTARFRGDNVPTALADKVGSLKILSTAFDIVELAQMCQQPITKVACCYYALSQRFHLDRLRTIANQITTNDYWVGQALSAVIDDLWKIQASITHEVMSKMDKKTKGEQDNEHAQVTKQLEQWYAKHEGALVNIDSLFNDFFQRTEVNVSMFSVLQRQLRRLIQHH